MIYNCCQISPLVFIINILLGFYQGYILYGLLFLSLIITSLLHHTYYAEFTYIIDKVAILYVILYGYMLFKQKIYLIDTTNYSFITIILSIVIVFTFVSVFYLYYYGYYSKKYCFDENTDTCHKYHSIIHYISCFSHVLVMIL